MAVFRVEKNRNYTVMSNYHLKDKELSLKAKGLLSLMLSLPDDWNYTLAGLISLCKENETAIANALKELKEFGYLQVIKKYPNKNGITHITYEYVVYEQPRQLKSANFTPDIQGVENQPLEEQVLLNTNKQNTKELKINNNKYIVENKENLLKNKVCNIVNYLNKVADTKYRTDSKETIKLIKARLAEGYKEEDFYTVIDNKWATWRNTEFQQYMRPSTLFGNKFENYLNSTRFKGTPKTSYGSIDNTAGHFTGNKAISDEQFNAMTFEEKKHYISQMAVADMTNEQQGFFNEYCLARDDDGNLLTF